MSGDSGEKGSAEKALSFFRVFDVAFLAPGTVVFAALLVGTSQTPVLPETANDVGKTVAYGVASLTAIFTLGLSVHALRSFAEHALESSKRRATKKAPEQQSWFETLNKQSAGDLALYFWYLRATCANLAAAVALSTLFLTYKERCTTGMFLAGLLVAALLWFQGRSFDEAKKKAAKHAAEQEGAHHPERHVLKHVLRVSLDETEKKAEEA